MSDLRRPPRGIVEWPTLVLLSVCYAVWMLGITVLAGLWMPLGIAVTGLAIALQSSLQHEVIQGHPFKSTFWNALLVFPALTLCIPYIRFRDTHLEHHLDANLTDPYDDPESNYLDPGAWHRLPRWMQRGLRFNNTLLGRLILGPLVSQVAFMYRDWRALRSGDRAVLRGWLWHLPAAAMVLALVLWAQMPLWSYLAAAYIAIAVLKIRTFLEHQAHERVRGRTVIIEDRGVLALLFLNNNLHVVHHMHPKVPWYRLPQLYWANRDRYVSRNEGYFYTSYGEVFRRYLFTPKDPVPHPLWRR